MSENSEKPKKNVWLLSYALIIFLIFAVMSATNATTIFVTKLKWTNDLVPHIIILAVSIVGVIVCLVPTRD